MFFDKIINYIKENKRMVTTLSIIIAIHILLLVFVNITMLTKQRRNVNEIFKMVDVTEFVEPEPEKPEETVEIAKQDEVAEDVIETEKEIKELEVEYLPQHKISIMPVFPPSIQSSVVYPPLALKQEIEGVVYLELFIDQSGLVRSVKVLKEPGFGFAEAAIKVFTNARCIPAQSNGIPVAARIRYPMRFQLKK